jgi:DNA-binding SARP family transcriptional activator
MGDPQRAILVYVATKSEQQITVHDMRLALWPTSSTAKDISQGSLLNYISELRRAIGSEVFPDASGKSGYRVIGVETDSTKFQGLAKAALRAPKEEAVRLRTEALSLVRGEPLATEHGRYFDWYVSEGYHASITRAVVDVAHQLSTDLILAGQLVDAEAALRQGLVCAPTSMTLWEQLTDVLLEHHDQSVMALHWRQVAGVLSNFEINQLKVREHG